jgi:hypothetical protein
MFPPSSSEGKNKSNYLTKSIFIVHTPYLCSGSIKLDLVLVLKQEITYGFQDTFLRYLNNYKFPGIMVTFVPSLPQLAQTNCFVVVFTGIMLYRFFFILITRV